ncbi:MAG: site-specific DNA-methyltransferase [Terriglobales bacterium]
MPRAKSPGAKPPKRPIERYEHSDKTRINNPPVGLVTPATDPPLPTHRTYGYSQDVPSVRVARTSPERSRTGPSPAKQLDYDPHLDPQLVWAGKKEHTSFEVPTVSLHVHERIDSRTIIDAVRKRNGNGSALQPSLFERREENPPLREAIDFYRHAHGWSNRLTAGDSLLVMNSLLEKEGMAGQVQMVYIDPPYGIKYGSNFQPFVNKRDVKDGKDDDLTQEPEMIKAFKDTWELEVHSYLTYLRDRLLLSRDLLSETGSVFVQIGDENAHLVRSVVDDVFGRSNICGQIAFAKTSGLVSKLLASRFDYLLWYAKDAVRVKYRQIFVEKSFEAGTAETYSWVELPDGQRRGMKQEERRDLSSLPPKAKIYRPSDLTSQGNPNLQFSYVGRDYEGTWKTTQAGLMKLGWAARLHVARNSLRFVRYLDDFPAMPVTNWWEDTGTGSFTEDKLYVVQTGTKTIARCLLMTTDPGDLVFDPTCGSGTTAYVAEQWGRRWITCDTSRVASRWPSSASWPPTSITTNWRIPTKAWAADSATRPFRTSP